MFKSILALVLLATLISCKENGPKESMDAEANDVLNVEIPEDFVEFYNKFHSDSTFQINHIIFPLAKKSDGSKWQKKTWKIHKAFNDQNGAYQRSFDNFNGIIFETIVEKTGAYKIVKRYSKTNDSYNLIYYTTEVSFKEWEKEDVGD